jgi:S-adenosylmethionine synthetase
MFGYACRETPELMPAPIYYAHAILKALSEARRAGRLKWLRPDAKSQVTVRYANGKPAEVTAVVISTQHSPDVGHSTIRDSMIEELIKKTVPAQYLTKSTVFHINPTGSFVVGGPHGDCGVTGRKIIVDTYGGYGRHGGGALSGKDPSKVDRSACYMARYAAKNIVAAGLAQKCEIQVAYAIGVAEPVSLLVDTFGTGTAPDNKISSALRELFDFRPSGIIRSLKLKNPIYKETAAYGHFGRDPHEGFFTWERTDLADALKRAVNG